MASSLPTAISFSGCGFLGIYHVGLAKCFQTHGRKFLNNLTKFAGASAGSLVAAVLAVCPDKISDCKLIAYNMATTVRTQRFGALTPGFRLSTHVEQMIDSVLPQDAHKLATERVFLSVTRKKCGKNFVISDFPSRADLIQCLVSSCHIPFYSGNELPYFRGEKYYDGGFTNNLINFDNEKTVLVTPFSGGKTYICPNDSIRRLNVTLNNQDFCVNLRNLSRGTDAVFPPKPEILERYYEQGFIDGLRYLAKYSTEHPDLFTLEPGNINPRTRKLMYASALKSRSKSSRQSKTSFKDSKTDKYDSDSLSTASGLTKPRDRTSKHSTHDKSRPGAESAESSENSGTKSTGNKISKI